METPEENMRNAGIVFMFTAWIQGQMSDLVIFKKHPEFIQPFIETPNQIPAAFAKIRFRYWEKHRLSCARPRHGNIRAKQARTFSLL